MDWLSTYLEYTSIQVSPRPFHLWSAMAVIGGALERRIWFECIRDKGSGIGRFKAYPGQLMVVLVSKSAVTKKTTAATLATRFLRYLEPWQVYVTPKKFSGQQLLKDLQRFDENGMPMKDPDGRRVNSAGFLFCPELGTTFSSEAFAETLAATVADLNDCHPGKHEIAYRSWKAKLWQPCLTMLGCITPRGIAKELPESARTGGWFGRVLWVHMDSTERKTSLMAEVESGRAEPIEKELIRGLRAIAKLRGEVHPTPKARKWYNEWYNDVHHPWVIRMNLSEREDTGYIGRKDTHLIRVAMVVMAAKTQSLVMKRSHLEFALHELETIEKRFPAAFAELGTSPYQEYEERLVDVIERWTAQSINGVPWIKDTKLRHVLRRYGGDRRHTEAITTLMKSGEIVQRRYMGMLEYKRVMTTGRLLRRTAEETGLTE